MGVHFLIRCLCFFRLHTDEDKAQAAGAAAAEETSKNGNNIGNGAGGAGEHGRLGTPAFINLPESHLLKTNEIEEIAREIELENELQVRGFSVSNWHSYSQKFRHIYIAFPINSADLR